MCLPVYVYLICGCQSFFLFGKMSLFSDTKFLLILSFIYVQCFSQTGTASSDCPEIFAAEEDGIHQDYEDELGACGAEDFVCRSGECIRRELLCDGRADCPDQSDETRRECTSPELDCPRWSFRCDYGACVHGDAACNGVQDCADNSDELLDECPMRRKPTERRGRIFHRKRLYVRDKSEAIATPTRNWPSPSRSSTISLYAFCRVPPQPLNGRWKLDRSFCKGRGDCDIPQGVALEPGSRLVYTCFAGFRLRGKAVAYCKNGGNWSGIPICVATACAPLNSVSRAAACSRFGDRVSCQAPVLPYTRATITCRYNYGPDGTPYFDQEVECSPEGRWYPEPMGCVPACGMAEDFEEGTANQVFPWHANVWREILTPQGLRLEFRCSATIVDRSLVLTAAHCVVDERTGLTDDPEVLRVSAKSVNDAAGEEPDNQWAYLKVKQVFRYCESLSRAKGYASDIALIRLFDPLEFSKEFLPACLDVSSLNEQGFLPGAKGTIAGFGRTLARPASLAIQTAKVTRVGNAECRVPSNASGNEAIVSEDELCAVYFNETDEICDWDSGGGLVVKLGDLWHLEGVFSVGFASASSGNAGKICGGNPYSIYAKTSTYMSWIQEVLYRLERYGSYPSSCTDQTPVPPPLTSTLPISNQFGSKLTTQGIPTFAPAQTTTQTSAFATESQTTTPFPTTRAMMATELRMLGNETEVSCLVPPRPANGEWKLHPELCEENSDCDIPDTVAVRPGIQLVCICAPGFRIKGSPTIFCSINGRWSNLPSCVEITCDSLNSVSRSANCFRSNIWTPCNSSVLPNTRVDLNCRLGYEEDTDFSRLGSKTVECNEDGTWSPRPITCSPLCGVLNSRLTPTILNGTAADITEFPWHASLYRQETPPLGSKEFICGATIIQNNLLLTAAHCVYNETFREVDVPGKYYIATGNRFRDYDSPLHQPRIVQKSAVKNIYVPCEYYGFEGNYVSDIALIELREPFQLSNVLMPACVDVRGASEQILEAGSVGRFAGFGGTATGMTSALLLTTNISLVSFAQCRQARTSFRNVALIGHDKICGGGRDGMAVCKGDSGGGLVFENAGSWNVMGVLSVNLAPDMTMGVEVPCSRDSYALYTKVSTHVSWIQNVLYHLERDQVYPSCGNS